MATALRPLHAFFQAHKNLLEHERQEELERSKLLLSNHDAKILEKKGLALGSLSVLNSSSIGLGGKILIELERASAYHTSPLFPHHTFRNGDIVRIEPNKGASNTAKQKSAPSAAPATCDGVVYRTSDSRIVIALDEAHEDLSLPEPCRLVKLANSVTYDRMDKAIENVETLLEKNRLNPLHQVLLAQRVKGPVQKDVNISFFDEHMNSSQKEAVRFCLGSPEVACIHGPPGTGKTRTLIEIILQLTTVSEFNPKPLRVLVCSASNLAVDNILERLLALPKDKRSPHHRLKLTRIGHPARVMAKPHLLDATLDVQATTSDQAAIARDVKKELEDTLTILNGKKGKKPRGSERKKLWENVRNLRKEFRKREGRVVTGVLSEAQVLLATCHSSGGRLLNHLDFDVVLIDEATQAMEAVCWVPILKGKKLILAGDPMQLPPTVLSEGSNRSSRPIEDVTVNERSEEPSEDLQSSEDEIETDESAQIAAQDSVPSITPPKSLTETLFHRVEKMYGPSVKRMLEVQYRMNDQICSFPSKTLYHSKLKGHETVQGHLLGDLPNVESDDDDVNMPVIFFDTANCEYYERMDGDGDEGSKLNENEATIAINWVERLISLGVQASQIALITPYQAQVRFLTAALTPRYGAELEIGTVDGMQGREKEAIIISLVRSNDKREVGFLKDKRRLNVAMTRAKRQLVVIGDSSTVIHGSHFLRKWIDWLEENADVRFGGLE